MIKKAVVIGAGFYGLLIGELMCELGFEVTVLESSSRLGAGASLANQARVHGGYHYPRSFLTASRSRQSMGRFMNEFRSSIEPNFEMQYAIAREFSKVSATQFETFCDRAGAPLKRFQNAEHGLSWSKRHVESVYRAEEPAFNGESLLETARARFESSGGSLRLGCHVSSVEESDQGFTVNLETEKLQASLVFDVTYASLGTLFTPASEIQSILKIEMAEIALFEAPEVLKDKGVTVMDGPFFSFMPFPAEGLHSLTHVMYTPRETWIGSSPNAPLNPESAWQLMVADAARFLPEIKDARYVKSIFVRKAVLTKSESNDSRPIFIHKSGKSSCYYSVLGAKIDNVYDALDALRSDSQVKALAA